MKTILQIEESQFRNNKTTERLMGFLRECDNLIDNNILTIRNNVFFDLQDPVIVSFNHKLRTMRAQGVVMVQILLD